MPNVVGLDLSLTSTGIAYFDPFSERWITESFTSKHKGMARLYDIRSWVEGRIPPDALVVVEGYSFSSRNSHAHALGELGGVIRLHFWEQGIPYVNVPPTSRAKFATGKGNAGKSEVVSAVSARTGLTWSGKGADDECDAWILQEMGLTHLNAARFEWPAINLSALDKVEWETEQGEPW